MDTTNLGIRKIFQINGPMPDMNNYENCKLKITEHKYCSMCILHGHFLSVLHTDIQNKQYTHLFSAGM